MSIINSRVPQQTRHLDTIMRVIRNSSDQIIAIQKIEILSENLAHAYPDGAGTFRRTSGMTVHTTRFNEGTTQNRVASKIFQLGNYDEFTETSGAVVQVVYKGKGNMNDIIVDLNLIPAIGATF